MPANDKSSKYSLLDFLTFFTIVSFGEGLLLGVGGGNEYGIGFYLATLPAILLVAYLSVSWGIQSARESGTTGAWTLIGLHLLGLAAVAGTFAIFLTLALALVAVGSAIGAVTAVSIEAQQAAAGLRQVARAVALSALSSCLLIPAIVVRRRMRKDGGE